MIRKLILIALLSTLSLGVATPAEAEAGICTITGKQLSPTAKLLGASGINSSGTAVGKSVYTYGKSSVTFSWSAVLDCTKVTAVYQIVNGRLEYLLHYSWVYYPTWRTWIDATPVSSLEAR